jgi:hypothetical protein
MIANSNNPHIFSAAASDEARLYDEARALQAETLAHGVAALSRRIAAGVRSLRARIDRSRHHGDTAHPTAA